MKSCCQTPHPSRIFAPLILSGLICAGHLTLLAAAARSSESIPVSPINSIETPSSKQSRPTRLPSKVLNAVRRDLSRRTQMPRGQLRAIEFSQETWPDSCLGLSEPDEGCADVLVEGWRVVMSDGRQTWVYRTDSEGEVVRLETSSTQLPNQSAELPSSVARAVLREASRQTGLRVSGLQIARAERRGESGWRVVVAAGQQRLVYRTNLSGSEVKLDETASGIDRSELPEAARRVVLRVAAERTGVPASQLEIMKAMAIETDGCLNLPRPGEACIELLIPAWQVEIAGRRQRLVYHVDERGSQVRLNETASNLGDANPLPSSVEKTILQAASRWLRLPVERLQITQATPQRWGDSCLDLPRPLEQCLAVVTKGWQVTVEGEQQRLVYHIDEDGARFRLNELASRTGDNLPDAVARAVLQEAFRHSGQSGLRLQIIRAVRKDWPDGCLGLGETDMGCTAVVVPGWEVTVASGRRDFVYRTDTSGSQVKLDLVATHGY